MMKTKNEKALPKPEPLPGAVCAQWKRCSSTGCHCRNGGALHGPYFYRFWRAAGGKLKKTYVPRSDVEAVRAACRHRREQMQTLSAVRHESLRAFRELRQALRALERLAS